MSNVWLALITGLTTGGISCMAVQGGFLAASLTDKSDTSKSLRVSSFLAAKLLAYTFLGFLLGTLGSSLLLTPKALGFMQIAAGIFMLATAARLLNIHPFFRYLVIQPPRFIYRLIRNESRASTLFTPMFLGILTILIPCGVTQAMMALAIASGNAVQGALIMFAFVLGTSPVFFALGIATLELLKNRIFVLGASTVIIFLGLLSINTGQILRGSPHTAANYVIAFKSLFGYDTKSAGIVAGIKNGVQEVVINAYPNGYVSDTQTLKVGRPVKLTLTSNNIKNCTRTFLIPSLGISKVLPENGSEVVEFTPTKTGLLAFTCGMGMYTGEFSVVN